MPTGLQSFDIASKQIVTIKQSTLDHDTNNFWLGETRPILEAFWHSKYFLQQMRIHGRNFDTCPQILPSGLAAVLYLYNLR